MKHDYSILDRFRIAWLMFRKPHYGLAGLNMARATLKGETAFAVVNTYKDGRIEEHHFKMTLTHTRVES